LLGFYRRNLLYHVKKHTAADRLFVGSRL
jgi:hypothetical protein